MGNFDLITYIYIWLFNHYWVWVGLPLSRLKGSIVDSLGFSVVEVMTWLLILSPLFLIALLFFTATHRTTKKSFGWFSLVWIVLVLLLVWGQGVELLNPWPTYRRPSLAMYRTEISKEQFLSNFKNAQSLWLSTFDDRLYRSMGETEVLALCNTAADEILQKLKFPPGRPLRNIKPMGFLGKTLGLSYGGPAFHDPLTSEVAIVRADQYPTTRLWRHLAVCHETIHAKGFTREMDTEILTYLMLKMSSHPYLHSLAALAYLQHSQLNFKSPPSIEKENIIKQDERKIALEQQLLVRLLRSSMKKMGLQNSSARYGYQDITQWDSLHPYFSSIAGIEKRLNDPSHPL